MTLKFQGSLFVIEIWWQNFEKKKFPLAHINGGCAPTMAHKGLGGWRGRDHVKSQPSSHRSPLNVTNSWRQTWHPYFILIYFYIFLKICLWILVLKWWQKKLSPKFSVTNYLKIHHQNFVAKFWWLILFVTEIWYQLGDKLFVIEFCDDKSRHIFDSILIRYFSVIIFFVAKIGWQNRDKLFFTSFLIMEKL